MLRTKTFCINQDLVKWEKKNRNVLAENEDGQIIDKVSKWKGKVLKYG